MPVFGLDKQQWPLALFGLGGRLAAAGGQTENFGTAMGQAGLGSFKDIVAMKQQAAQMGVQKEQLDLTKRYRESQIKEMQDKAKLLAQKQKERMELIKAERDLQGTETKPAGDKKGMGHAWRDYALRWDDDMAWKHSQGLLGNVDKLPPWLAKHPATREVPRGTEIVKEQLDIPASLASGTKQPVFKKIGARPLASSDPQVRLQSKLNSAARTINTSFGYSEQFGFKDPLNEGPWNYATALVGQRLQENPNANPLTTATQAIGEAKRMHNTVLRLLQRELKLGATAEKLAPVLRKQGIEPAFYFDENGRLRR